MTTSLKTPNPEARSSPNHRGGITEERYSPRFINALRTEWIKLTTVRSSRAILVLTVLVGGVASFMVARFVTDEVVTVANVFGFSAVFTAVFAAVSGILIYTTEAEYQTAQQTFAAEPRRSIVVAAKTAVTAIYSAVLGLSGLAAGALGAAIGGAEAGDTSTITATVIWATGFSVLAGTLGLGIGLIARQSAAAISGVLVWWLVIENLVGAFAPERVIRFMPFFAGNGMLELVDGEQIAFSRPLTTLIFASYGFAFLVIGAAVTARTDP